MESFQRTVFSYTNKDHKVIPWTREEIASAKLSEQHKKNPGAIRHRSKSQAAESKTSTRA